jgi:hypothetical protein
VPTVALDASWDNFTNKLIPVRQVDRLIVWNDLMKQQAVALHGMTGGDPRTGAPQFDVHFGTTPDRLATRSSHGLAAIRPQADHADDDAAIALPASSVRASRVVDAMRGGRVSQPVQVLVRLHPRDEVEAYRVRRYPNVIIEKPFRDTVKVAD